VSSHPRIFRVRQSFDGPTLADVPGEVKRQLSALPLAERIKPGQTVAVTAGSRGIAKIAEIIKASVEHLKSIGAKPFIVPAMGSHGGGTAEGQVEILHGYGVTEEFCGCPIRASMETVIICQTKEGFPVHFDKFAHGADHVLVVGRVKPHTGFVGDIESGLMKMMLIGLGKHAGAIIYHRAIQDYSFPQIVRSVAGEVIAKCRIVAGLGIVENEQDKTAKIQAVLPEELEAREKELLVLAKKWIPRLPFDRCHLLLVDQIGKNISGSGMDTNVIGRKYNDHKAVEEEFPKVKVIAVRALTEETHGNACGIGMAEFCRSRVVRETDVRKTRINCLTGGHAPAGMFPFDYETDREMLDTALPSIGLTEPPHAKLLWIHNTLDLIEVECGEAYLPQAREKPNLEILTEPRPLPLDAAGNLPDSVKNWR
jgi:hypothetical protein